MAFINGFLVWFIGHMAFILLGAFAFGWAIVPVEIGAFFASLPALVLYILAAGLLQWLRLAERLKASLYAVFCLSVTAFSVVRITTTQGAPGDDFLDGPLVLLLRCCATGATALSLLFWWKFLRKDLTRHSPQAHLPANNNRS